MTALVTWSDKFSMLITEIEHVKFVEQVVQFRQDFESGKAGLSYDVMNFLKDWLVNHIQESDKEYAALFIENGVN